MSHANNNQHGVHQLAAMQGLAARATLGLNDSDYRSAYLPMKKPTKFIVTLKPVPKTENQINGTERSVSGCCCKYLPSSRLHLRASDASKGKPVLNAFRVLTNSKFMSIDPTYNIDKDPILAAALNNVRLTAGGLSRESANECANDNDQPLLPKHSDASTSTHIVEARVPPPSEKKQRKWTTCCFRRSKDKAPPPVTKVDAELQACPPTNPYVDTAQQTEPPCPEPAKPPPPKPQPQPRPQQQPVDDECPCNLKEVASRIAQNVAQTVQAQKPRLTFSELLPNDEPPPPPKPPPCNKAHAPPPPPPPPPAPPPVQQLQDVASRILQTVTQALFPSAPCEQPTQSVTEICKPRDIKTTSTGILQSQPQPQPRAATPPPCLNNMYIEQQCSRMKQLEARVEKMRKELNKLKADFVPEKDMLRCTALTKKLQELNALLLEVKNRQLPCGLSSMSTVASPPGEKLQNQLYYSDHGWMANKRTTCNSAVQVDRCECQDCHSQTVTPIYACTGTGSSPVTTPLTTATSTPARTTPRSSGGSLAGASAHKICASKSFCPFCECMEFQKPVVEANLSRNIQRRVQNHGVHDVVLAVLLQPDNSYHINISTISGGESLGCLYANDAAISEAHGEHLFEKFLTFFIVDARNSKVQKHRTLGHTFEFFKK